MIGQVVFSAANRVFPSYVIDGLGNLVRCGGDDPSGLIPGSFELVSTASSLANPQAWTITVEAVEKRLHEIADLMPAVRKAYPDLKISSSAYPFAARLPCPEDDASILEALDAIARHGEEATQDVITYLNKLGIFKLPRTNRFNAAIHSPAEGEVIGDVVVTLADGWYSFMKVYRKAVVR
ncbi:TPA: hypothetical protein NIA45_004757 [Pseudomonas aeruginosa]|nr:hypothetical protein [Pseudomonas aeruginosa]